MDKDQLTFFSTVSSIDAGSRLDHFLSNTYPQFSRSRLQQLIKQGAILLNDAKTKSKHPIKTGDKVTIHLPPTQQTETLPEHIPLAILHEDADLIIINKPSGMVVHPAAGNEDGTLVNALLHHCNDLSGIGGIQRPGIVHRLDKDTSGCLAVAKNDQCHQFLSSQFANRQITKIYLALVHGHPPPSGKIRAPIGRHPVNRKKMAVLSENRGKIASTDYTVLQSWNLDSGPVALLRCNLHTGRTHQIRVHLRHIGHPIVDDPIYGKKQSKPLCGRLMLHAWQLSFTHPSTSIPLTFEAPPPPAFKPWMPING